MMETKKLGFGFMRLPLTNPADQSGIDMEQLHKMVDLFMERGFTYYDSAYIYHDGQSEIALREAVVKRYARESFLVATKMPVPMLQSKEQQEQIFNEQLKNCGVDYFDFYLLHGLSGTCYPTAIKMDSFEFLCGKKEAGTVRNIGFSFHDSADMLDKILTDYPMMDFVQLQINYLDWDNATIQSRRCYEVATKHGKKVIVMEPIKGGVLANIPPKAEKLLQDHHPDMSVASWAVRFAASHDNVITVLSGMSDLDQVRDNTGYMQNFKPLTHEEFSLVSQVTDIVDEGIAIPCTACRYCVPNCPKNIAIPEYFAIYNAENNKTVKSAGYYGSHYDYYLTLCETRGKPSDCIGCRECEGICPQHLRITDLLKTVAQDFDSSIANAMDAMKS